MPRRYRSFISHLHSTFEGPASISGFCREAALHGIDLAWLTDHDTRVTRCCAPPEIPSRLRIGEARGPRGEDFWWQALEGVEMSNQPAWAGHPVFTAFQPASVRAIRAGRLRAVESDGRHLVTLEPSGGDWQAGTLSLRGSWPRPLITRPVVEIELETEIKSTDKNRRLVIEIQFTQSPPDHRYVFLRYCLGNPEGIPEPVFPLRVEKGKVCLDLVADARQAGIGREHMPRSLRLRLDSRRRAEAGILLGPLSLSSETTDSDTLLARQAALAGQIAAEYGCGTLVSFEISGNGTHMNCYGHLPPVVEYPSEGPLPAPGPLGEYFKANGCVLSINHPFSDLKREDLDESGRAAAVERRVSELSRERAFGARLLEVGFPEGRHGFSAGEYLALWDGLNLSGLRLAGIGVSDAHGNYSWESGNNFANYAAVGDDTVEALVGALDKGDFFMADPVRFKSTLDFRTDRGKTMGEEQSGGSVLLEIGDAPADSRLTWVIDGRTASEKTVSGKVSARCSLAGMKKFVRAGLWSSSGRLVMLTNPIWAAREVGV